MNIRDGIPTTLSVVHLAHDENSCAQLDAELRAAGFDARIEPAHTVEQLRERLERSSPQLLILDLPLSTNIDAILLDELSLENPELKIHFRWLGAELGAPENPQALAQSIGFVLGSTDEQSRDATDAASYARQQRLFLELSQVNAWEFEPAMERFTELLAEFFQVPVVGIWEITAEGDSIRAIDLYDRRDQSHCRESVVTLPPDYRASLSASLAIATHDAQSDPRLSGFLESHLIPHRVTAVLDVPIRRSGEVVGVICHEHVGDTPRDWSPLDRSSAAAASALIAHALEVRDRRRDQERIGQLEKIRALGELSAGIAHDLNNMLGIVMGNVEYVLRTDSSLATASSEALERACESAERVNRLINDLLAVGRGGPVSLERIELHSLLTRLEPLLRAATGESATLRLELPDEPVFVTSDPAGCTRVLVNLAKNAGEALVPERPGEVSISLTCGEIAPGDLLLSPGHYAVVSVRDNGCGIEEEIYDRMFEPFFTSRSSSGGTGLGLATSYGLAHRWGGTIRVESTVGEGSCFHCWIPLLDESPAE